MSGLEVVVVEEEDWEGAERKGEIEGRGVEDAATFITGF